MASKTVLVAGANRGIGLHFMKTFKESGWDVVGTIRPEIKTDASFQDLEATGARILEMDFLSEDSIQSAAKNYGNAPLDCLVNCAGIKPTPQSWAEHSTEFLKEQLTVMVIGPFLVSKQFHPNLKRAKGTIVNMAAGFGSISTNDRGLVIGYRMAKAALNQQTKTLAQDFKHAGDNITVIALNPGYIATKMTGCKGVVDMDDSVQRIVTLIEDVTPEKTGRFFDYTGDEKAF